MLHAAVTSPVFVKQPFNFILILHLQKSYKYSSEMFPVPFPELPLC